MEKDTQEQWHVGKEIPVAVIMAFFIQTIGAVWWAATLTSKIDELSYQVAALTADRYTQNDAKRDQALLFQRLSVVEQRVDKLEVNFMYGDKKWQR